MFITLYYKYPNLTFKPKRPTPTFLRVITQSNATVYAAF